MIDPRSPRQERRGERRAGTAHPLETRAGADPDMAAHRRAAASALAQFARQGVAAEPEAGGGLLPVAAGGGQGGVEQDLLEAGAGGRVQPDVAGGELGIGPAPQRFIPALRGVAERGGARRWRRQ
jgi:hypothetical protein